MKRQFETVQGAAIEVSAQAVATGGVRTLVHEIAAEVTLRQAPNGDWLVERDGVTRTVQVSRTHDARGQGETVWVSAAGVEYASLTTRWTRVEARRGGQHAGVAEVRSPMTGRVVVVHVSEGQAVEKGQALVVVEAMKMEHTLKAPSAGVVAKIACKPGQLVEGGVELVVLDPLADSNPV